MLSPPVIEFSSAFLQRLNEEGVCVVHSRTQFSPLAHIFFFSILLFLTPLYQRHPNEVILFGILFVCVSLSRVILNYRLGKNKKVLQAGLFSSALLWSLFNTWIVARFEIGWTSFLSILLTLAIATVNVDLLSPCLSAVLGYLSLIFIPAILTNIFFIGGLKGNALAVFDLGFFLFLMVAAHQEYREFCSGIQNRERLHAMINAVPGTLSWVDSHLRYLGVNHRLAQIWQMKNEDFQGMSVGFTDPKTEMADFVKSLFACKEVQIAKEMNLNMAGENRSFYVVGQKYNHDSEAVILGLDVTDYKNTLKELESHPS